MYFFIQDTFFDLAQTSYSHEATVVYECGRGMGFRIGSGVEDNYTLTCEWGGAWSVNTTLPECECGGKFNVKCGEKETFIFNNLGTACLEVPTPDTNGQLETKDYDDEPVAFNESIAYTCLRGQRFNSSVDLPSVDATCRPGNIWEKPDWDTCVESKNK